MNLRKIFISISNKHDFYYRVVLVSISILIITSFLPQQVRFKYNYKTGQPWNYEDLRAPFAFPVFKSNAELDAERTKYNQDAPLFYKMDSTVQYAVMAMLKSQLVNLPKEEVDLALKVVASVYDFGVFDEKKHSLPVEGQTINLVQGGALSQSDRSMHLSMEQVQDFVRKELSDKGKAANKDLYNGMLAAIRPNLAFDGELTSAYTRDLLRSLSPVRGEVQEGTIIIRRGQLVGEREFYQLESLRKVFQGEATVEAALPWLYLGYLLLVFTAIAVLVTFLWILRRDILFDSRKITLLFLLIIMTCIIYSVLLASNRVNMLMMPLCILPLITRAFFDTRTALFTHVLSMLILGTVAPGGFNFVYMQVIAGMVAIFSIVNMRKRSQLFLAVSLIFVAYMISFVGLSLLNEGAITKINPMQFLWLGINCLLTLLSYPLIFFIEKSFRVTSDFTLMELTDFNSELLRDLGLKAPGTFQHSLQVANLAESAIYKIGGNSLLVRVGALYHDIGKMDMPMYFIENQSTQINPHDELSFDESASIIISHVIKGIEKAKKFKLPDIVIDFIRTHHGTMMVQYFYNNYIKSFPDQIPNEDDFRYPGPRPFSKETAVLMMADSVEAAARSLPIHDQDAIDNLVEKIISKQIESGQFENCDITYRDISSIKKIFKKMLTSIYHVRVAYPS
ncbi:MAG: HDIG domain-containing protein [Bacteroidetes bacterium]|nr:HDIG domain-containing protein [Bacteroidota bacterium]